MNLRIPKILREKNNGGKKWAWEDLRKHRAAVLFAVLVLLAAALFLLEKSFKDNKANPFKNCSALEENCMDTGCAFYSSCGESGWKSCKIYDCGNDYGIYSVDKDGKVAARKEAKPDHNAIEQEKDACKGTMEILEQKCVGNEYQARVQIVTNGECKIGNFFVLGEDGQSLPNNFTKRDSNIYWITSDVCTNVTDIIPASEDGMALEF